MWNTLKSFWKIFNDGSNNIFIIERFFPDFLLAHDLKQNFFCKQIQNLKTLYLQKELDSCVDKFHKFLKKHLRY